MKYQNSPKMNKFLGEVSSDFIKVHEKLEEASYEMMKRGFKYPVFILSKNKLDIPLMIDKHEVNNLWFYHISYLKLLIDNKLISKEKESHFKENYKNPEQHCCLLILDPEFSGIVFMPYPDEDEN
ncbi:MAG: hypothetical protein GY830_07090 [Bacteroidetes bacterium]|nr:hypothetical protein [Bacteroidota bacterium]